MTILLLIVTLLTVFFFNRSLFSTLREEGFAPVIITVTLAVAMMILASLIFTTKSSVFSGVLILLSICVVVLDRRLFLSSCSVYRIKKDLGIDQLLTGGLIVVGLLTI